MCRESPDDGGRASAARLYPGVQDDVRGCVASFAPARAPQGGEVTEEVRLAVVVLVGSCDDVVYVSLVDGRVERLFALDQRFSRKEVHLADVRERFRLRQEKDGKLRVTLVSLSEEIWDHGRLDEFHEIRRVTVKSIATF